MGLFDTLDCHHKWLWEDRLQTKDLECAMGQYKITVAGRLLKATYQTIEIPPEERKEGIFGIVHSHETVQSGWKDTHYHGIFIAYKWEEETKTFREWSFKFTDGDLIYIKEITEDATESEDQAAQYKQMESH